MILLWKGARVDALLFAGRPLLAEVVAHSKPVARSPTGDNDGFMPESA